MTTFAFLGGTPLCAAYRANPNPGGKVPPRPELFLDIVVHPHLRSTSVATRILREIVPLARSYGASRIRDILTPNNRCSLHAYERAGFNKVILLKKTL
jgi:GNAT superfamily N-acetyltransferase